MRVDLKNKTHSYSLCNKERQFGYSSERREATDHVDGPTHVVQRGFRWAPPRQFRPTSSHSHRQVVPPDAIKQPGPTAQCQRRGPAGDHLTPFEAPLAFPLLSLCLSYHIRKRPTVGSYLQETATASPPSYFFSHSLPRLREKILRAAKQTSNRFEI